MVQQVNCKRLKSYGWLILLVAFTSCDPWNLPYLLPPPTGLVAYYPFNGNTLDSSGNKLHGQLINGATYGPDRTGSAGLALSLDGVDDYVEVPDDSKLRPDTLSVSVWIKAKEVKSTSHIYNKSDYVGEPNGNMVNQSYNAYIRPHTALTTDCCEIRADVNQDGICKTESNANPTTYYDPAYQMNRWYHIVTVFVGQSGKIYVNGDLKSSQNQRRPTPIDKCPGGNLRFGAFIDRDVNNFNGLMDEIRIYNRALTDAEVQALYKL